MPRPVTQQIEGGPVFHGRTKFFEGKLVRDFEMCGVTSSNATCNEALFYATITSRVSNGANALINLRVPTMSTGLITEDQQNRVPKASIIAVTE